MYLLDTNVVSELWKTNPDKKVSEWRRDVKKRNELVFISVITLGEIKKGIAIEHFVNPMRARTLEGELLKVEQTYRGNILDINREVSLIWGEFCAISDENPIDALLASQAKYYELTLVTRNIKDVKMFDVDIFNPF